MRSRIVLAAVLVLAGLAGCLGAQSDPETGPEDRAASEQPAPDRLEAPVWEIGDHWTWRTAEGDEVTLVVTGEDGGDWIVDTTDEDVAFFHARFSISYLGSVRKADLAGSQQDTRVVFFDWPLEANKTWTTTWDGVQRETQVENVDETSAQLTAREDGEIAVSYTYDAQARHFGEIVFYENGTQGYAMELEDAGTGFEGEAVRWQLDSALDETGSLGVEPTAFGFGFEVPEEARDIWLDLAIACPGTGSYDLSFGPSGDAQTDQGSSHTERDTCPAEREVTEPVVEEPAPGEYRGGFTASSTEEGTYSATLLVRTLETIAVGEG